MESIKKFEEFLTESLSKYDGIDEIQDSFKKHKRTHKKQKVFQLYLVRGQIRIYFS